MGQPPNPALPPFLSGRACKDVRGLVMGEGGTIFQLVLFSQAFRLARSMLSGAITFVSGFPAGGRDEHSW